MSAKAVVCALADARRPKSPYYFPQSRVSITSRRRGGLWTVPARVAVPIGVLKKGYRVATST